MARRDVIEARLVASKLDIVATSACQHRDRLYVGGKDGSLRVFAVSNSERCLPALASAASAALATWRRRLVEARGWPEQAERIRPPRGPQAVLRGRLLVGVRWT